MVFTERLSIKSDLISKIVIGVGFSLKGFTFGPISGITMAMSKYSKKGENNQQAVWKKVDQFIKSIEIPKE